MSQNNNSSSSIISDSKDKLPLEDAKQCIWDYMLLGHELKKAEAIVVLGSFDTNVGVYAAQLFMDGWAPLLVCAGSGSVNHSNPAYGDFAGSTEAEIFADIAVKQGVPKDSIIIENRSQNTGQNYEFTTKLLKERDIDITKAETPIIVVQKQFMERRTYATGKIWWPAVDFIVTSPPMKMCDYPASNPAVNVGEHWIHAMCGDLQRIREYPALGFQIPQDIPEEVWTAFKVLRDAGYVNSLLKN